MANESLWKEGERFHIDADISNDDYNVRAVTDGTVMTSQISRRQKMILVTLDYVDGDSDVTMHIPIKDMHKIA